MESYLKFCGVFSVVGVVFLTGLGWAFTREYEYLPLETEKHSSSAKSCFYAAVLYALASGISFLLLKKSRPNSIQLNEVN